MTDRVLRQRYTIVGAIALASAVVAGGRGDWDQFVQVGSSMLQGDGLHVYVRHPDVQTGPLSLLLAWLCSSTTRNGFVLAVVVVAMLGVGVVGLAERLAGSDRRARLLTITGGALLLFSWTKLGGYGHLDDALVLTAAVAATTDVRDGRRGRAAIALGLAVTVKPWAVILLPILLFERAGEAQRGHGLHPIVRRWAPLCAAVAVAAAVWAPFVLTVPDTIEAIRPTVAVAPDSVLQLVGLTSSSQLDWLRPAQFVLAITLGLVCIHRRRVEHVLLAVIAVRLATDPGTWSYYTPGLLVGALLWDAVTSRASWPMLTVGMALLLAPDWLLPDDRLRAVLRLGAAVMAVALAISGPAPSAAPWSPTSDRPATG